MSIDDRTEPLPFSLGARDSIDFEGEGEGEGERILAERLRRAAREAPAEPSANDTDPSSFDTEPTTTTTTTDEHESTLVDAERTRGSAASMENAPELVAALAQFSGRALQEAKFQAASDGRGAARYDAIAVPARSLGGAQAHAAEVIIATTPSARIPAVATGEAASATFEGDRGRAEPDAFPQAPANVAAASARPRREGTTIPGLHHRSLRRSRALAIVLVAATVLLAVGLACAFGFSRSTPSTSTPSSTRPPEARATLPPTVLAPPPSAPAPEPNLASTAKAPRPATLPTGDGRAVPPPSTNRAPPAAAASTPAPKSSESSARPSTAPAPVTPSDPKREPPAKSDFVW